MRLVERNIIPTPAVHPDKMGPISDEMYIKQLRMWVKENNLIDAAGCLRRDCFRKMVGMKYERIMHWYRLDKQLKEAA